MSIKWLIVIAFLGSSQIAWAEEKIEDLPKDSQWTVGISGGVSVVKTSSDQKFGSFSINKNFGDSYAGISVSYTDSGTVPGLLTSIPASTTEITLSAGSGFGALSADGYVSLGKRNFDTEKLERNGQIVNIDSGGNSFGTGLSISYDIALSDSVFLTPIAGIDYNSLDIQQVANLPNGNRVAVRTKEDGVTGSFGAAVQHLFGEDDDHLISIVGNVVTTSNTTSFNPGDSQFAVLRVLGLRDGPGQKDSWGEIGGSLSFDLNESLRWDISIIRTIGFLNSDITSLSTGLRFSF